MNENTWCICVESLDVIIESSHCYIAIYVLCVHCGCTGLHSGIWLVSHWLSDGPISGVLRSQLG